MDNILFLLMSVACVATTNPGFKRALDCYVSVGYNIDYQGTHNRSSTGSPCLPWKVTTWANSDFDGTMNNNYCRNPDKDIRGPWCVVESGNREYCTLPKCASSAMFDGEGNVIHNFHTNSTTEDTISLSFYTNREWQDDATIFTVASWKSSLLVLKLSSNSKSQIRDILQLQWRFGWNVPPFLLHSRPNQANQGLVRVEITRKNRQVTMRVNDEEYTGIISPKTTKDAVFASPGNVYIGKSPYGRSGFQGCVADVSYNGIRSLDMAMGLRPKTRGDTITISSGVWEGCILLPPSDWTVPPTTLPEPDESKPEVEYVISAEKNTTSSATTTKTVTRTAPIVAIFLFIALLAR